MSLSYELHSIFRFAYYNKILNAIHLKTILESLLSILYYCKYYLNKNNKNDFSHRERMHLNFFLTDQMRSENPEIQLHFQLRMFLRNIYLKKHIPVIIKTKTFVCMNIFLAKIINEIKIYKTLVFSGLIKMPNSIKYGTVFIFL